MCYGLNRILIHCLIVTDLEADLFVSSFLSQNQVEIMSHKPDIKMYTGSVFYVRLCGHFLDWSTEVLAIGFLNGT